MVHALREAHRVLKPNGLLFDLRPAKVHRRAGILAGGRWRLIGALRESFDDDVAADRAVAQIVKERSFRPVLRRQFVVDRVMDTIDEFHDWVGETVEADELVSHRRLIDRMARALESAPEGAVIDVRGPLVLRLMAKAG